MRLFLDSLAILSLFGVLQAILLAGVLFGLKRGQATSNRLLAAFLTSVAVGIGGLVLANTKYVLAVPHLAQIHAPFGFLMAPLLFLYIRSLVNRRYIFSRFDCLHFIPAFLLFVFLLPFYFQTAEEKILYMSQALEDYPVDWRIRSFLVFLQQLIYLIFIYRILPNKKDRESSAFEKQNFYFAKFFTFTLAIAWIIGIVRLVADHRLETNLLAPFVGCLFIFGLVFKTLQKPEILGDKQETEIKKYEKSTLKPDAAEVYLAKIASLMENEKIYLDKTLTLRKMARRLFIPAPHLSQLINENLNQSFADFVNSYRVEEFKKRFSDPQNDRYTITAIAEASGFNSKSAFNAAFKKHTSQTPSEFKRKHFSSSETEN